MVHAKGDFTLKAGSFNFRGECKSTTGVSMALDSAWLAKISEESRADGSIPVLTLSFVRPDGQPRSKLNSEWAMIPLVFFKELTEGR